MPAAEEPLPEGLVTLLFSDIEGSTRLARRLREGWGDLLESTREESRAVWRRHSGVELGTEGDSFFVAFSSAADGLAAAIDLQRVLEARVWTGAQGESITVRARVGLHTGRPERRAEGYVGLDVHCGARIAAAAHGGQVLCSQATWQAAGAQTPERVTGRDLGPHRLKDFDEPIRLVEVIREEDAHTYPAPRSVAGPGALPTSLTPLLAREAEVQEVVTRLAANRLVTLTGPGGVGKTRLALAAATHAASHFPDGAFFVPLATVFEAEEVWPLLANRVGLSSEVSDSAQILHTLAHRECLLLLDNVEQLSGAAQFVSRLLAAGSRVRVLVTSRRALMVPGEQVSPVGPLPDEAAAALFRSVAQRVRPSLRLDAGTERDIAALCAAVDGLPLAIEIVAARCKLFTPHALAARITTSRAALDVLSRAADPADRHSSLRAALTWSHELLGLPARHLLAALAVHAGPVELARAIEVAGADLLDGGGEDGAVELVEASMVTLGENEDGDPTLDLLATVRAFTLDTLAGQPPEQESGLLLRHLRATVAMVDAVELEIGFAAARRSLESVIPEIRLVLERRSRTDWHPSDCHAALDTAITAAGKCVGTVLYADGLDLTQRVGESLASSTTLEDRWRSAATTSIRWDTLARMGRSAEAEPLRHDLLRRLEDLPQSGGGLGVLPESAHPRRVLRRVWWLLAWDLALLQDAAGAREAVERLKPLIDPGDDRGRGHLINVETAICLLEGDLDRAEELTREGLKISRSQGIDTDVALSHGILAEIELRRGRPRAAQQVVARAWRDEISTVGDPDRVHYILLLLASAVVETHPELAAAAHAMAELLTQTHDIGIDDDLTRRAEDTALRGRQLVGVTWDATVAAGADETQIDELIIDLVSAPVPETGAPG